MNKDIIVREFSPSDHEALQAVSKEIHEDLRKVYKPSVKAKKIGSGDTPFTRVVALLNNEIVGMATFQEENNSLYFGGLGVLAKNRGQGIAKCLIKYIENEARKRKFSKISCSTIEERGTVPFYKKLGFKIISRKTTDKFIAVVPGINIHEVTFEKKISDEIA